MLKTEVERLEEKDTVLLRVEVPADEFGQAIEAAYKRVSGQLVIPGFRKGKVPKSVIDARFGRESIKEEALQNALPRYYAEALQSADIEPVAQPEVEVVQVEDDKPLIFTAKIKVKPEVELGNYKGLEVEKPSVEPTEEEIDQQIETIRNNFANLEPVEGRAVKGGDYALINFEGFIDDKPFEGGSANDYLLEIGSGTFIPGFEDQLVGMKKGEVKDINVTFPGDYGNEQLAGKDARFRVLLKEIKEKHLQNLDDDFAKQIGFDTLGELRADIGKKIRETKEKYADAEVKSQVVDAVTGASEAEVPDVMVDQELDEMLDDFSNDIKRQGLTLDRYLELVNATVDNLRNDWRDRAKNRVKSRLVLEAISKTENIEVSTDEVDNEIRKAAEATGRDYEEVKQIFAMKGSTGALKERILIGKTIDWLVEHATVKEIEESQETEEKEEKEEI